MNTFGVPELKEFQKETVDNLLDGKDVCLSVKTGAGKIIHINLQF